MQRIIWMVWLQGEAQAPALVRACVARWRALNPTWTVRFLDQQTLSAHVEPEIYTQISAMRLPPQKIANLFRLYLINRHGGVWADADLWCTRPLDDWLPALMTGGFFAFRFPADAWLAANRRRAQRFWQRSGDLVMDNWFLAGEANNAITSRFFERHRALLAQAPKRLTPIARLWIRFLSGIFRYNAYLSAQFSRKLAIRLMGYFPYFVFHYHFGRLVLDEEDFRRAWQAVPAHDVRACLLYSYGLLEPADDTFQKAARGESAAPVLKLHWYKAAGDPPSGSRYATLMAMAASL